MYNFVKLNIMNKGTFTYALLQYHHSQLLGEVLNIGLIVYFPTHKRLEFIYPERLIRLTGAYPEVPEKTIKSYFKYFKSKVDEINSGSHIFHDYALDTSLKGFLENEFLAPDSSVLQFGNYRTSVLYTPDLEHITNQLYNLYFSVFKITSGLNKKIDESVLLKNYKKLLNEFLPEDQSLNTSKRLYSDYSITPEANSPIKFDIAWQKDKELHLVRPVSFDLIKPESIRKKTYLNYGQFNYLQEFATENDYLFDVILAKPRSKSLFKAYDEAIHILQQPKRVNLIEQDNLESYSKQTVNSTLL